MIRIWINERRGVSYIANLFNAFKRLAQDTSAVETDRSPALIACADLAAAEDGGT
jgi:hypothetical protein